MTPDSSGYSEKQQSELNEIKESYDQIPYQSFPYPKSSPAHLRTIGKLFGMDPPSLETARILELGCAAGGNLIPTAVQFPQATFTGVDLSEKHVNAGQEFINQIGLTNIELKLCSITEIDESFGQFDYIIAHGVFSWVPDFVREKIFSVCQQLLSPTGIAYISYNTLPGWNTRRIIRDMAIFHGQHFEQTDKKIEQTKELLNFISQALEGADDSYAKLIMESVNLLKGKQDYYIAHDFLEINNKPFYFSEFIQMASSYELKYLSEASVPSMYLGNYSNAISTTLGQINDIIKAEQYLDFITNRHFRSTLLCHKEQDDVIERTLAKESLYGSFLKMSVVPNKPLNRVNLHDPTEEAKFEMNSGQTYVLTTSSPILKAVFYTFSEFYNIYIGYEDLVVRAAEKLTDVTDQMVMDEVDGTLITFYLSSRMDIRADAVPVNHQPSEKPKVWSYAAAQCSCLPISYVTNLYHEPVPISIFEKFMIPLLDGTRTKQEVLAQMMQHVRDNDFDVNFEGKKVETEDRIFNILSLAYIDGIEKFATSGLLV